MTQSEILYQLDQASRRAMRSHEDVDVAALQRMYDAAIEDIDLKVRAVWAELQSATEGDESRTQFLQWKLGREQSMEAYLVRRLSQLRTDWTSTLRRSLEGAYYEQALRDAYALDMATPPSIAIDTRAATPAIAESLTNTAWSKALFSDKIWNITDDVVREIQNQLGVAAALGESVAEAVRRIQQLEVLDHNVTPRYAIERLARTELLKASDRAEQAMTEANSDILEGEQSVATLDSRTCEGCGDLDGKLVGSPEYLEIIADWEFWPRPPYHPCCRDRLMPVLQSWGSLLGRGEAPIDLEHFSDEQRVVRNPLTGKSELAPLIGFHEWVERRHLPKAA